MNEDMIKMIGITILVVFLVYLAYKSLKLHTNIQNTIMEGLENNAPNGVANSAATYAESITKQMNVLQDSLLISKYKTDYENVIINLEDYITTLMMDISLKLSLKDGASPENMTLLSNLNTLNNARQSLNTVMTFVDKH